MFWIITKYEAKDDWIWQMEKIQIGFVLNLNSTSINLHNHFFPLIDGSFHKTFFY